MFCLSSGGNLRKELRLLGKSKHKKRLTARKKEEESVEKLDNLFNITTSDALNKIETEENRQFLLQQRQKSRPDGMVGVDMKLHQSRSSIKRFRKDFRAEKSEETQNTEVEINFVVVYWNSNFLPDVSGKSAVDLLLVVATGVNLKQLLGGEGLSISSSTGVKASSAVSAAVEDWNLSEKVQTLCFDMTASNTGRLNGAWILLEQKLWLSCPDIPLFKKFQKNWKGIDKTNCKDYETDPIAYEKLNVALDMDDLKAKLEKEQFARNDYRNNNQQRNGMNQTRPDRIQESDATRQHTKVLYLLKEQPKRSRMKLTSKRINENLKGEQEKKSFR
ncbi:hypothetical protein ILUMI_16728 [Ignelater luminosus]|uniref:Uncharacterized protein n=1 Tax=Ignelater luminosus TaxID=2038154 RepID=A0A8K0CLD3_IGNLU|nr:hypothetical protein ILUMI_16728 [Ignelater luminosus]